MQLTSSLGRRTVEASRGVERDQIHVAAIVEPRQQLAKLVRDLGRIVLPGCRRPALSRCSDTKQN